MIQIKKLPFLPDLVSSKSAAYDILVEDFMVRNIKFVWHDITYRPDIVALIGKPADTLKGTVEGLTSPLTGEGGGTDAAKDTLKDAGDALKNLFGN